MHSSRRKKLAVSMTAVVAIIVADVSAASAQNLFDTLFGGNVLNRSLRHQRQPEPVARTAPAERAPVQRAAPPRVAGPSYYAYKTDPLVRVDFAAIRPRPAGEAGVSGQAGVDAAAVGSIVPDEASAEPLTEAHLAALQGFALTAEKEAAEALVAHYSEAPALIWATDGQPNERARAAIAVLAEADTHGLDPRDYALALPRGGSDVARFEMELSARVLRYVRDAHSGRIDPNRISGYHDFARKPLDQVAALRAARDADDVAAFLGGWHPVNPYYRALRAELAALRADTETEVIVAPGKLLRPGDRHDDFPKILALIAQNADDAFEQAHGETLTRLIDSQDYTQELVPVIKAAQAAAGIGADGIIGPRTIQVLAGESRASRIVKVEVALEQLRWMRSDLTDRYVFINTPAFTASYVEDGEERLSMRTVVGGLSTQTYFFQDEIQYVEFHPYWGVPRSILVNKYLPKLYGDPSYLDRSGFEVVDARGRTVPSSSVDWGRYGANPPFDVRQRPGRGNALGEMKIMFPNRHAIYMHDTPDKHLFSRDSRALSNGCIRLADPRAMAAAVLGWSGDQVAARLDQPHSRQDLPVEVPVYVAYFTAWPDLGGKVSYFVDVYSRDEKVRAAIEKVEALRAAGV